MRRDVRYGSGAIAGVPALVADLGARRVLLVCGARSFEASGAAAILPELRRVASVHRWSEFAPNPDLTELARGLAIVEQLRPDLVLGIGGGTALDLAKLLCAFQGITEPEKLADAIRAGSPAGRELPLVLAPTTSGSGSEATHFAVVYIGEDKYSVAGGPLRPDVAILDPALTLSGSAYQRASCGIDAVSQAIESLWAVAATERSRAWARHALRLLVPAIERFVHEPGDRCARAMAIGSHLAGRAIDITRTTAAHALSYAITKRYGVSHGHAVALTLGGFIEVHGRTQPARLHPDVTPSDLRHASAEVAAALGATGPVEARHRFVGLCERIGLTMRLPAVGIGAGDVEGLVRAANVQRLNNNPVRLTGPELVDLMMDSMTKG